MAVPVWLARAAAATGAKLVAFSSDQVYAGVDREGPLPENLPLSPANVYGRHKLEAEQRVLDAAPDAVLLRATWLYDLPGYGLPVRGNLPLNLLRAALRGEPAVFSPRDFRGVTYARQAVENLLPALDLSGGGVQLRQRERPGHDGHRRGLLPGDGHCPGAAARRPGAQPGHGHRQSPSGRPSL